MLHSCLRFPCLGLGAMASSHLTKSVSVPSLRSLGDQSTINASVSFRTNPSNQTRRPERSLSATHPRQLLQSKQRQPEFTQAQYYQTPFDVAYQQLAKERNLRKLESLFFLADADGSGEMSLDEFRDALKIKTIKEAFAALGVQPHQSELVFKSLDKRKTGELSITEFMSGLTDLVGTDVDGTGKELDIEMLRPAYKAKQRHHSHVKPVAKSLPGQGPAMEAGTRGGLDLGPVHLLPKVKVQRAFVHSASAQALHSATASKQPLRMIFPF